MGCVSSRRLAECKAMPAKLRPMLRRRIEEIRRHRCLGATKEATPSKRELLLDGNENDLNNAARKSASSPEDSLASCVTSEDSKKSTKAEKKDEEKEKMVAKVMEGKDEADIEDEGNSYQDYEEMLSQEDSIAFPGSPSFRVYFIGNFNDDDNDDDDGKKDGADDKTQGIDHISSPKKESVPKKATNGRMRGSLKKVISRGGQISVKNLFHVRCCYNPSRSSHEHAHLLTTKTSA